MNSFLCLLDSYVPYTVFHTSKKREVQQTFSPISLQSMNTHIMLNSMNTYIVPQSVSSMTILFAIIT